MNLDHLSEEDIFEAAFKLTSHDARRSYLRQVCRDDDQIERIQALLKEGASEASFLEKGPAALQKDDNRPPDLPERIGDFEILGELGRGGMGVVYRARQCSLNRLVALKVLSSGLGLTTKAIMRFKLEAEAAAKLHHTNIVPIYWTGEEKRVPYYVMELIDGPSLDRVIKQLRAQADTSGEVSGSDTSRDQHVPNWTKETLIHSLPGAGETTTSTDASSLDSSSSLGSDSSYYDNLAKIMADVADALAHAHDQGIIHRDIKPANLLLSSDGRLSINDFGLARMLEQPGMTMTGELMGSPMYMSPEQITAGRLPLDHRTDIYSLGASLYELLTLEPPFPGQQRDQVLSQVIHKDPPKPRSINPQIPRDLETICLKAMEKDPDRRYQTTEQMAKDLRCFVNRHAISARRTGPAERAIRWARKNKALTAMVCLTLIVGLGALASVYVLEQQHRHNQAMLEREHRRDQAMNNAVTAAMSGKLSEALDYIEKAKEDGADEDWTVMLQCQVDLFEGKSKDALEKLKIAANELGPDNVAAQSMLASAYVANGQWDAYVKKAQELKDLSPHTAEEYLLKGSALTAHAPEEAIELMSKAIKLRSDFYFAWVLRAYAKVFQVLDQAGDVAQIDDALEELDHVSLFLKENAVLSQTRLYARLAAVHLNRRMANLNRRKGDEKAEKECLDRADTYLDEAAKDVEYLDQFPRYAFGNFMRLYYYDFRSDLPGRERLKQMEVVMEDVIANDHSGFVSSPYWTTCYRERQFDKALRQLDRLKYQDDDHVAWKRVLFQLEAASGKIDTAAVYSDYLNQPTNHQWESGVLLLLGTLEEAARQSGYPPGPFTEETAKFLIARAGTAQRNLSAAYYSIGLRKLAEGDREGARESFQKAANGTLFHWTTLVWSREFAARLEDPSWPHWLPSKPVGPEHEMKAEPD